MYSKSTIMKRAIALCKTGSGLSASLKRAWLEAKLENVSNTIFILDMKDRFNQADRDMMFALRRKQRALRGQLNAQAAPMPLTTEEKQEIEQQIEKVLNRPGEIDWDEYNRLSAQLEQRVA